MSDGQGKKSFFEKLKSSETYAKLKSIKNPEVIVALILVALALIIYSGYTSSSQQTVAQTDETSTELELRLANVLSQIDGAGEVQVMIYFADETDATSSNFFSSSAEKGEIVGVIIVAEGADDIATRLKLLQATETALAVDSKQVQIFTKQK